MLSLKRGFQSWHTVPLSMICGSIRIQGVPTVYRCAERKSFMIMCLTWNLKVNQKVVLYLLTMQQESLTSRFRLSRILWKFWTLTYPKTFQLISRYNIFIANRNKLTIKISSCVDWADSSLWTNSKAVHSILLFQNVKKR